MSDKLFEIIVDKAIISSALLGLGFIISRTIERIKSNEVLKNEFIKKRVDRVSLFFDLLYEYEHWLNRLILQKHHSIELKQNYLSQIELQEAQSNYERLGSIIGFELNKVRFWINNDIYYQVKAHLELLNFITIETLQKNNFKDLSSYQLDLDSNRITLDIMIAHLQIKTKTQMFTYTRRYTI